MMIYFVRHGQTDWNRAFRWQGAKADNELNQTGRQQALALRDWFAVQSAPPSVILSSPLKRARATAQCIASAFSMQVISEPLFIEVGLGDFEGKTSEQLRQQYPKQFDQWLGAYHLIAPPGGESLAAAIERVRPILLAHIAQYTDHLVIVAHQAILMAMKAALSGDLSRTMLAQYKQANDEIDLWDLAEARILERVKLSGDA